MRLMRVNENGEFSLTDDLIDNIPRYAILSHTWGEDHEEVSFKDLTSGPRKTKSGYKKLRFCAQQITHDGLQYFWIDTCCIDKSNSVELQAAIGSMYRWYQNAARCYVYLSDVSTDERKASDRSSDCTWESAFRASRWFTRGWTLQELLASASVEFFSREGNRLGDKTTLELEIHEITKIPVLALRGTRLAEFTVKERMSWAKTRQTRLSEDKVYSLLGIFDVCLPLMYGEGKENALRRLQREIENGNRSSNEGK
jgi:Heterokaryon incompatibility protein (HET)